jgi:hypothetical protein
LSRSSSGKTYETDRISEGLGGPLNPRNALRNAIRDPRASLAKLASLFVPSAVASTREAHRILDRGFGQRATFKSRQSFDASGAEIPWFTYPAIEYLKQLDFSEKSVFEYGSGNSTVFWSKRCQSLASIEDNPEWFQQVKCRLPGNVSYRLCPQRETYVASIYGYEMKFDVIVVDGNHRYDCAKAALSCLSETGLIILDNSDWHERTSKLLRDADLIEVDFSGFGPIVGFTTTTSIFLSRKVNLKPAGVRQPMHGIGGRYFPES